MKVAIVEDEVQSQEILKRCLDKYARAHNIIMESVVFKSGLDLVSEYAADYDVIFMDIMMSFMDGIETAKVLRKLDERVPLIFVTNMPKFAIKGYEVDALGFLIKPVSYADFAQKMDKVVTRLNKSEKQALCVKLDIGIAKVFISGEPPTYNTLRLLFLIPAATLPQRSMAIKVNINVLCFMCFDI